MLHQRILSVELLARTMHQMTIQIEEVTQQLKERQDAKALIEMDCVTMVIPHNAHPTCGSFEPPV